MPSLLKTLKYGYKKYIQPKRMSLIHVVKAVLVIFFVSLLIECLVFNFKTISTLFNEPLNVNSKINLEQTDDGRYVATSSSHVIELKDLNVPVSTIYFDLDENQDAQEFTLKTNFTDSGHSTYFDSTEYTVGVPDIEISTASKRSQYFTLHTTGDVKNIKLEITGKKVNYPIYISSIVVNAKYPFDFCVNRFLVAFFLILLGYLFRPRSKIYRILIVDRPLYSRIVMSVTVFIEAIFISAFLLFGSNLVGVATQNYNYGEWDGTSVANTFKVGGDNAQQYAELAKSFTQGKLYLQEEPPDYLKTMEDPYDKGSRDEMEKQTGESYLFDVGYYDGHYYVYFGVVPVLLFYLPFYMLTGQNFPTAIGVLIMALLFVLGVSALLDRFARFHFKKVSLGMYLLLQIPLVFCSGVLYLVKFPTFYSLPIACSLALAVWGIYFWMRARVSSKPGKWFVLGSSCMALIAGCRPQIMLIAAIAIPLFWRKFIKNARDPETVEGSIKSKSGIKHLVCMAVPFVVVGIGLMGYNYARFGSVADFGANYNLTMNDMTLRGMQFSRIAPALFAYLLQPPNVTGVFPFLNPVVFETTYYGQTIKEVTFGGIFACLPVLWVLFFAPIIVKTRTKIRKTHTIAGVIMVFIVLGILIPILDAQMAGILQRYYADFSFMFLLSAILCYFAANETIRSWPLKYRKIMLGVLLAVVAISVLYSLLICFVQETGWYGEIYNWAYRDFLRHVMFWI